MATKIIFITTLLIFHHLINIASCISDLESLLKLKISLQNTDTALSSWNTSVPPCTGDNANWSGVLCYKGHVWGFKLENMNLKGIIDVDSIKDLPYIRTLSFMNNNFDTSWPDLSKLPGLKTVYLSNNKFSGEVPAEAFQGMQWLKKIYLSNNQFTGPIPTSLASLPRLISLRLDGNRFSGPIPEFNQTFKSFSVANNQLEGEIPATLRQIPTSSFSGNEKLCGAPLGACSSKKKSSSMNVSRIMAVVLVCAALLVILAVILLILIKRRKKAKQQELGEGVGVAANNISRDNTNQKKESSSSSNNNNLDDQGSVRSRGSSNRSSRKGVSMRLSFVREEASELFDLQDLLRAAAEILGSGCHSSSYKADLLSGPTVVVKRFKHMNNVGREEFREHMRRLGKLKHPNLLPLLAYYYKRDEKLFITDFVPNGSLAVRLHGYQAIGQKSLDWPTRFKIVKGVAQGMEYLYKEMPNMIAPHGHLKSSNVLLSESMEPVLTDYGLVPVINQDVAHEMMVIYKSPEYLQHGRITKKTDVWSLGILILEILTGKFSTNFIQQSGIESELSLANWVDSVVPKEWSREVFDKDIEVTSDNEEEMVKLLKIALDCCELDVDKRLDLKEAVDRIQEVHQDNIQEDMDE